MQRVLLLALLPAVAACGGLRRFTFTPPDVTVTEVGITGLGFTGGTLMVSVRVTNPNAYALRTTRGSLALDLDGTPFGTLELVEALQVPAGGEAVARLPMTFTWSGVGAGARAMLGRGSAPYRLTGRLDADTPIGVRGIEVSRSGAVTLADLIR